MINALINCFWFIMGVSITLYANREIPKIHAKKPLQVPVKPMDLNKDFENIHRIIAPLVKSATFSISSKYVPLFPFGN
jgi:hypothetical protein